MISWVSPRFEFRSRESLFPTLDCSIRLLGKNAILLGVCKLRILAVGYYCLYSFQTTRRHSYDGYSINISIFNSFFLGIYPVGVTDFRPYFMQIIGYNSINVHRIPTKVGTEICLNVPIKCAKLQSNPITHSCLWRILQNEEDEEKEEEEKPKKLK